jgi:hypothetical protein
VVIDLPIPELQKEKTMLDLRLLVPRELFRTEDRYNEELEKVLAGKGGKNKVVLMESVSIFSVYIEFFKVFYILYQLLYHMSWI